MGHRTRVLVLALAAAGTLVFTGCNDTHNARCNDTSILGAQNLEIGLHGWTLRCDPDAPDLRYNPPSWVIGYADPAKKVVALWPDRQPLASSDNWLRKTAWHEFGHILGMERGVDSESYADGVAWCMEPIAGVSYFNMPTDCGPYLP